jgi:hypothetical protein
LQSRCGSTAKSSGGSFWNSGGVDTKTNDHSLLTAKPIDQRFALPNIPALPPAFRVAASAPQRHPVPMLTVPPVRLLKENVA